MAYPKVTVVGAGQVGATAAELLLLHDIADVVLVDVVEGMPQGKALDLMHMRSVERFGPTILGTNDYADTRDSDVVVVTAGLPRRPGMTRDDLLAANRAIVESVFSQVVPASPKAVFICVTNPLDVMTYLAWKVSGLPSNRVFGMGGVLDSARFAFAIAEKTGADIADVAQHVAHASGRLAQLSGFQGSSSLDARDRIPAGVEAEVDLDREGVEWVPDFAGERISICGAEGDRMRPHFEHILFGCGIITQGKLLDRPPQFAGDADDVPKGF